MTEDTSWPLITIIIDRDKPGSRMDVALAGVRDVTVERIDVSTPADGSRSWLEVRAEALSQAAGTFVAFVSASDFLPAGALRRVADSVAAAPSADVFYTNEVEFDGSILLKPAFSPERLRGEPYLRNLTLFRRSAVEAVGGLRGGCDGVEFYDLALRLVAANRTFTHINEPLFTTGGGRALLGAGVTDTALEASGLAVVQSHLDATGGGVVRSGARGPVFRSRRKVIGEPLVSVIIPTRGDSVDIRGTRRCLVVEAVRALVEGSTYKNIEIVVVIDDVSPPEVRAALKDIAGDGLRFVEWEEPFSFSGKMNLGVVHSRGDYLLLLNDDIEPITPDWIEAMLALAQRPGAGIVGALLYFEDDTIQHAGHAYYHSDVTHIGLHSQRGAAGPRGSFLVEREVNGATAACAIIPRSVFFEAGGFSGLLPANFNDVDLCMKIETLGYQAYVTPFAELYHFESQSRDPQVTRYEIDVAWGRWGHRFWDSVYWPMDPHLVYTA